MGAGGDGAWRDLSRPRPVPGGCGDPHRGAAALRGCGGARARYRTWPVTGYTAAFDPAIVCGGAFLAGRPVMVVGEQKGRDTKQKLYRNFGMPKPEGYRKALRVMQMAGKFNRPIITLLDTPGAYPGIDA